MTEHDWLAGDDPLPMLAWLWPRPPGVQVSPPSLAEETIIIPHYHAPLRKLRLFLLHAFPRLSGDALAPRVHLKDLKFADRAGAFADMEMLVEHWHLVDVGERVFADPQRAAHLLREIVGNPYVAPLPICTADVLRVAGDIYHEVRRDGTLRAGELMVLADALEDAGCAEQTLLAHLRAEPPVPHVRGCWALDLVMRRG